MEKIGNQLKNMFKLEPVHKYEAMHKNFSIELRNKINNNKLSNYNNTHPKLMAQKNFILYLTKIEKKMLKTVAK